MNCIAYKAGYKYQLKRDYSVDIDIHPDALIDIEYLTLTPEGKLTVKDGYAWDGPSGPTIDTLNFMRGSLVHDALYQLMRERHLDHEKYRETAALSAKDMSGGWHEHHKGLVGIPRRPPRRRSGSRSRQ